jgi:hypothetical protein
VEIVDVFGTTEVLAGKPIDLTCQADQARPAGTFKWQLTFPSPNGQQPRVEPIVNYQQPIQQQLEFGAFRTKQVL